jgi:hypothetical protein
MLSAWFPMARVVQQPLDDMRLDFHFRQRRAEGAPQAG